MKTVHEQHLEKIRQRFTSTSEPFAQFALIRGRKEGERLASMALQDLAGAQCGVDLACGPGTFARSFAGYLREVVGVDFTPAMLRRAERSMADASLGNVRFVCADVNALPFASGAFDVTVCGYALHHFLNAPVVIGEMARVTRSGGRVAIVDLVMPEDGDRELHDRIERARDPSHTSLLKAAELNEALTGVGLRVRVAELDERERDFDEWMRIAGSGAEDSIYTETRRLLESTLEKDAAGFHPRVDRATGPLRLTQLAVFAVAEKP